MGGAGLLAWLTYHAVGGHLIFVSKNSFGNVETTDGTSTRLDETKRMLGKNTIELSFNATKSLAI